MRASSLDIEQTAAAWLARRDGGAWSDAEQAALERWLQLDTAHRVAFLRLQAAWSAAGRLRALGAGARTGPPPRKPARGAERREQMLQALQTPARRARSGRAPRRWLQLAAVATLAACALFFVRLLPPQEPIHAVTYASAPGVVRTLTLDDGSHATLSSDSRIEVRFSAHARDVSLRRGEAIFEVAKNPQRPFRVAAEGYRAIAVGTRYSVRRDGADLRVVVTEGTVRLESPGSARRGRPSVLLPAGSVATVQGNDVLVRSLPLAQVRELLDWRNGVLAFRDAPLSEVAAEFNRFNTRKLVVADPQAAALRIGGSFRWDNEEGFVRLLEAGFPVRAEAGVDRIVLHSR